MRDNMKNALNNIIRYIEWTSAALTSISMWGVLGMMILISWAVFARYLFNSPLLFADEMSAYFLVFICFMGAAGTLREKRHITVDIAIDRVKPRVKLWLRLVMSIISLGFLIIFFWHSFVMVRLSFIRDVRVPSDMLTPVWIPQSILVAGSFLLILQLLVEIWKQVKKIKEWA
jgi:TRAP-type C4-dicarboxylate transport system permease small subunit